MTLQILPAGRAWFVLASITLLGACLPDPSAAQEKKIKITDVPAAVRAAFAKEYPKATVTGAATEVEKGVTYFELESKDGKIRRDLLYTASGAVAEIEEAMPMSALPAQVKSAFEKKYPNVKGATAEKVTEGDAVKYEFHFTSGKSKMEVSIDAKGTILKGTPDSHKDADGDEDDDGDE